MKLSILATIVVGAATTLAFPHFDASKQCFNLTEGEHQFVAPGAKDIRGMCPGLNSLANHGFIPHNGVATFQQLLNASIDVFGTADDIANLLAAYGVAMSGSGDVDHMSIGGPPGDLAPITEQMIRTVDGLAASHGSFESDVSPTRGDLYEHDSITDVQQARIENFALLYEKQDGVCPGSENYSLPILGDHRAERLQQSIANNPDLFLSPFGGLLVSGAAHSFIFQLFANRSAEHPEGLLNRETLTNAFGISVCDDKTHDGAWWGSRGQTSNNKHGKCKDGKKEDGKRHRPCNSSYVSAGKSGHKYKYEVGHERLPNYWCKRADPLNLAELTQDIKTTVLAPHPEVLEHSIGGNTGGKANTWTSIDLAALTNGTYPSYEFLLTGNNYACLGLQQAVFHAPLWLDKMYANSSKAYGVVLTAAPLFDYLDCPKPVAPFDATLFDAFPGWTRSFSWEEWN